MNRKEAAELLPIIKAFSEGRVIQMKTVDKGWQDIYFASLFDSNPKEYRIKPGSKYRPFRDSEECWQEMLKHEPFGWVKNKDKGFRLYIVGLNQKRAFTQVGHNYDQALDEFTFADGTTFGILEEE